jgi:uncharacterized repeat protein (TIGR03803 family)
MGQVAAAALTLTTALVLALATVSAQAQTYSYSVLYSFMGGTDGAAPQGSLALDAQNNLYGTTYLGGNPACNFGCGTVFKLDATGKETVLYRFTGGADGAQPFAGVILDAHGNLYGTTFGGGVYGQGTVFKVDTTRNETVLYSFTGGADGAQPRAGVILDAQDNLYGTASVGGNSLGEGTVFKVDTSGKETVLHTFAGASDGFYPQAGLLLDAQGNLYGTNSMGGQSCGQHRRLWHGV